MTSAAPATAHATGRQKLVAHAAMMLFAVLIAGSFSFGAVATPHIGSAPLNALRFVIGAGIMGAFAAALVRGGIGRPKAPWRYLVLGILMAVYFVTMFVALAITSPVSTGAVFTLIPLMSGIFGWMLLGQVMRPTVIVSLLLAGSGAIWVIFGGDVEAILGLRIGRGEMIFFVGCVCHAAYAPFVKKLNRGEPVMVFTFWTLAATALVIAAYGARQIVETDWSALPLVAWAAIAYLAIFTTAGTFFLLQFSTMRLPAAKVLAYGYLTPAVIILIEGLLGHGWASASVMAGALVTVLGLIVLALAPDG